MKKSYLLFQAISLLAVILLFGCGKYKELAPTDYPDQVIYMPSAGQVYEITVKDNSFEVPTPGNAYSFRVDESNNKVIIPLGVVRAGTSNKGSVAINLTSKPDTVNLLINNGKLKALLLPQSAYDLPGTITLLDGKDAVLFDLTIDRNFLVNHPDQSFAVGVNISSKKRKTNPDKETTVIVFNTNLLD